MSGSEQGGLPLAEIAAGAPPSILMVTAYWPPHRGGIETVAQEQARRLARRGHTVSVITSRLAGDPAVCHEDGVAVHRVAATNELEARCGIPFPVFAASLVTTLRRLVPAHDVTLIYNHTYLSSVAAALVARWYGKPTAVLQSSPFVRYGLPWDLVEHGADLLLGGCTLRAARRLLAISEHTRGYVRGLIDDRPIELLWLGVDTQRFTPAASPDEKRRIRARLGLPESAFTFFTARRLVFRNGLDTLLGACARLRERSDVVTLIGGRGPERGAMERRIADERLDNVRLLGFIPDELLADYYRAADAFVLPSRTGEGFGLVLLEAFASGIPAVATRGGGQEEVVDDGRTGLLVPPGAEDALAAAMLRLCDEPGWAATLGQAARARAVELDWERCVDQLANVLGDLAGGERQVATVAGAASELASRSTLGRPVGSGPRAYT